MEVFFRELNRMKLFQIAKKAAEKVNCQSVIQVLNKISNYARNGREAVNMIQIAAGSAITEDRNLY